MIIFSINNVKDMHFGLMQPAPNFLFLKISFPPYVLITLNYYCQAMCPFWSLIFDLWKNGHRLTLKSLFLFYWSVLFPFSFDEKQNFLKIVKHYKTALVSSGFTPLKRAWPWRMSDLVLYNVVWGLSFCVDDVHRPFK